MNNNEGIIEVSIDQEMKSSYLDYAMSVIVSRAIPDVRDGMKPVHRRILYAMNEIDCAPNKPHKKSARIVGEVIGKYHPHGDTAIYHAMVRMGQDFSVREKLVDGQGNFGSIDADPPASMRYTEARLSKLSQTMMKDLEYNTVNFQDNYDATQKEPTVLPATFPNILVNGTEGIAVGMATNVPTHNLGEVIDCCLAYLENPNISDEEILQIIPGPDFPTGAQIIGRKGATQAILSGRGSVLIRGVTNIEEIRGGKQAIVITEIPYQVIKTKLIEKIVELVKEKKVEGITNIRDETNKKGIRIVIEIKKDAHADVIINHLYKHTPLQTSFSYNMLLLNYLRPELMNVRDVIKHFLNFREEIIIRRTNFLLTGARNKAHNLIGLCVAVDNIDEVIKIIRSSQDTTEARQRLSERAWPANSTIERLIDLVHDKYNKVVNGEFYFTDTQVRAILDMKLSKLTGLEKDKLVGELEELSQEISRYLHILSNRDEIIRIIAQELTKIKEEFATPRKTEIIFDEAESVDMEAFIPKENMLITTTINGFIKRSALTEFNVQKRGGKGKMGMDTNEGDDICDVLTANTHQYILFFSNIGKVYRLKTHQLPLGNAKQKGRAIVNILPLLQDEKITKIIAVPERNGNESSDTSIMFATMLGNIRKSSITDFENINSNGKIAIRLDDNDKLIDVTVADEDKHIMLCTKFGNALRFAVSDLRTIKSRTSDGVRGISLSKDDEVVSMCVLDGNEKNVEIRDEFLAIPYQIRKKLKDSNASEIDILAAVSELKKEDGTNKVNLDIISVKEIQTMIHKEQLLLAITENGYGKRTSALEYRITSRGGKGVININTDDRNGSVVSTFIVYDNDEVMMITKAGKIIRCNSSGISVFSRSAKGVRIFDIEKSDKIVSVAKIIDIPDDSEE